MNLLNRLTLKNLKLNKKRTAVTIVGIILATAMITTVSILAVSAKASLIANEIEDEGRYHYAFICEDAGDVKYIKENRQVESWYAIQKLGYAPLADSRNEYKPYLRVMAMTEQAIQDANFDLVEGRMPENETELVIAKHIRTNGGVDYKVGDTLSLDIGNRELSTGETVAEGMFAPDKEKLTVEMHQEYTIVGMIERPGTRYEQYEEAGYSVFTYMKEPDTEEPVDVYVYYKESVYEKIHDVAEEMSAACGTILDVNSDLIRYQTMFLKGSITSMLYALTAVIIGIIMVTSIFCIRNSFAISITEKMKQYGMLASVGATSKQIRKNVFFEAGVLALMGIPFGILSGMLAAAVLIFTCNTMLNETLMMRLVYHVSIPAILAAVVLAYVTILISAGSSAFRVSRMAPLEAIRGNGEVQITSKSLRTPKLIKRIFGMGGELAYKNLRRSRKKYRTTVISIVVSVSLFIAMWSFMNLAFTSVGNMYEDYKFNFYVAPASEWTEEIEEYLKESEEVEAYAKIREETFVIPENEVRYGEKYKAILTEEAIDNIGDFEMLLVSLGDKEYERYLKENGIKKEDAEGKAILYSQSVIYTEDDTKRVFTNLLGYEKGEKIHGLIYEEMDEENPVGSEFSLTIAGVADTAPMGREGYNNLAIVSDATFTQLIKDCSRQQGYDTADGEEEVNQKAVFYIQADDCEKLEKDLLKAYDTEQIFVQNLKKQEQDEKSLFVIVAIFLYGFIAVISLIGVTNIFNTITTNMELRSREFAMLRSVGMTGREFSKMIRLESVFYGGKALAYGIPIGTGLSYLIYRAYQEGLEFEYELPIYAIIICTGAVVLLIGCIMRYSMNKIKRQNIIETIRNENI